MLLLNPRSALPPMSISIDDLTSSLSSSHIDQEAIELAALQVRNMKHFQRNSN
jgi:hypothetical protein